MTHVTLPKAISFGPKTFGTSRSTSRRRGGANLAKLRGFGEKAFGTSGSARRGAHSPRSSIPFVIVSGAPVPVLPSVPENVAISRFAFNVVTTNDPDAPTVS